MRRRSSGAAGSNQVKKADATVLPSSCGSAGKTPSVSSSHAGGNDRNRAPPPRFAYLIKSGLESIGVTYLSMDHLRKAKKNLTSEREYLELWKVLHDLVLVVLADFEIDRDEMLQMNTGEALDRELLDSAMHCCRMEIVRFYLYEWGFVCASFYDTNLVPSSQVLLLAFAWLLAYSRFFDRQQRRILATILNNKQDVWLPPYPNDIVLSPEVIQTAADTAFTSIIKLNPVDKYGEQPVETQIQSLHCTFGRLQHHLRELKAYTRFYQRLLLRLEHTQNKSKEHQDELLPAYVMQLLAQPQTNMNAHVRMISQSIQMIEDEQLFYKWINGLLLNMKDNLGADSLNHNDLLSGHFPALYQEMQATQTLFQANHAKYQQIYELYVSEWKRWKQHAKSRIHVHQMEEKQEKFTHEVSTRELFDPQRLFLQTSQSSSASFTSVQHDETNAMAFPSDRDLERLQAQLKRVLEEISTEYCQVQLL